VKDQVDAVRVLLEWGADPDAQLSGATPLFIAATKTDLTMFRLLLDAGADVNVTKAWTQTPAAKNDGDLWQVMEDALARAYRGQSPKRATERTRAIDGPSRQ
jgi:ankyrin repeat protein